MIALCSVKLQLKIFNPLLKGEEARSLGRGRDEG
jgi:hypothetical protein